MRFRPRDLAIVGVTLSSLLSCASRPEGSFPTLEDYSDGISVYAEDFLGGWRTPSTEERLYAGDFSWSGPLPGDELTPVSSRSPLSLAIYRGSDPLPAPALRLDSAALRQRLKEIRARFSSLGRSESAPLRMNIYRRSRTACGNPSSPTSKST